MRVVSGLVGFEWRVALRFLRPKRTYVSLITVLSLVGVMLGVMVLILVLSVMEGFQRELRDKIIGFHAHLTVSNFGVLHDHGGELAAWLEAQQGVQAVTPFVVGPVLVEAQGRITTPYLRGLDTVTAEAVLPMRQTLVRGEWLAGPDSILVGLEWARRNGVDVGDRVMIYAPRNIQHLRDGGAVDDAAYLPSEYEVVGVFSTGFYEYDYNFVLVELAEAARLYAVEGVHGYAVRLDDAWDATRVQERMQAGLEPPLRALTWMDLNRRLVSAVAVERRVMTFLLFFIMLVAAFGLSSTLITVTVQKTREIGLMKALGAGDMQIVRIFTLYGFLVGLTGAGLGTLGGLGLLLWRNEFSGLLESWFHVEVFPAEIYNFLEIPAVVSPWTVVVVALSGVALSTGAALFPALAAARIDPARALHHE